MRWLMLEICRGAGVTYENGTGDYRGATYSSVRMAGAMEWLTVMRRRDNIVIPFSQCAYETWLEERIGTGRIGFPGGIEAFRAQRGYASHTVWTGPPRPQADDFKTARAFQVRKDMGAITIAEIASDYGQDWDDMMRQQAAENALADELDLPRPWAPTDIMQKPEGEEIAFTAPPAPEPADTEESSGD
jgi:capsid protein